MPENGTTEKIYGNELCFGCGATCWGTMCHYNGSLVCVVCATSWIRQDLA